MITCTTCEHDLAGHELDLSCSNCTSCIQFTTNLPPRRLRGIGRSIKWRYGQVINPETQRTYVKQFAQLAQLVEMDGLTWGLKP